MSSVSVLTVNFNADDFTNLLIQSIQRFDDNETKILIVENSSHPRPLKGAVSIINEGEKGHGEGINLGLKFIDTEYVLILDCDCHILDKNWQKLFLEESKKYDVTTVPGSAEKPIRIATVFMRSELARQYDWRATPGYKGRRVTPDGYDTGISCFYKMKEEGKKLKFMDIIKPGRYETVNGEEYCVNGIPTIFHFWHGAHLKERAYDYPDKDLIKDKEEFFIKIDFFKKIRPF